MYTFKEFLKEAHYDLKAEAEFIWQSLFGNRKSLDDITAEVSGEEIYNMSKNTDFRNAYENKPLQFVKFEVSSISPHYNPDPAYIMLTMNQRTFDAANDPRTAAKAQRTTSKEVYIRTIVHELSHYVRDASNNSHLQKRLASVSNIKSSKEIMRILNKGKRRDHQLLTDYELDAQYHELMHIRDTNKEAWETFDFDIIMNSIEMYKVLKTMITKSELEEWRRYMITRMSRDNAMPGR